MRIPESAANPDREWQKTPYSNLIRHVPSGVYYARLRVKGKLIRKSLPTDVLAVGKLQLGDLKSKRAKGPKLATRQFMGDAMTMHRRRIAGDASLKPRTRDYAPNGQPSRQAILQCAFANAKRRWTGPQRSRAWHESRTMICDPCSRHSVLRAPLSAYREQLVPRAAGAAGRPLQRPVERMVANRAAGVVAAGDGQRVVAQVGGGCPNRRFRPGGAQASGQLSVRAAAAGAPTGTGTTRPA